MSLKTPAQRWCDLVDNGPLERTNQDSINMLAEIDKIDQDTPWQEVEPNWWLSMMDLRKMLREEISND